MLVAMFIGRKTELKILNHLLQKRIASLIVIRGRRRIGKSRLATEFGKPHSLIALAGLAPKEDTTAQMERNDFAGQMSRALNMPLVKTEDWGDLFWHLAEQTKNKRHVILMDEIQWMGRLDPTFLGKLKNAWDMLFSKNNKLILILSGSLAGWIEENIITDTGFLGRISLDIQLKELSLVECNEFWGKNDTIAPFEKLKSLCVTGGVPKYLEELIPKETAEQNIKRLCFSPGGFLVSEFDNIFSDLFSKKNVIYRRIVKQLAQGPKGPVKIAASMGSQKSGTLSKYLEDLLKAGFISRDFTWHLKNGKPSKLSHFRLSDNYVRFYLKYIDPIRDKIQKGALTQVPAWYSIMGLQFENCVLNNRPLIWNALQIDSNEIESDNPFFQTKKAARQGCQIDYLIQTRFNILYACEIKFHQRELGTGVISDMKKKLAALALPRGFSVRPVLLHVNGVSDAVREDGYFSNIISFGDLLIG